jgi:glycerophosphoryl diester phosphodiesterase
MGCRDRIADRRPVCHDASTMTLVIAHRGASRIEQENTVAAFRAAVAVGSDGIELDVRRTLDDRLVVHHDPRLADGRVIVRTASADLPEHVPDLATALDACVGAFVNIEIKNGPLEPDFDPARWIAHRVAVEIARRGPGSRWLVSSFDLGSVLALRRLLPHVRTAALVYRPRPERIAAIAAAGGVAIHPWVERLDEEAVRCAHRAGLAVNTWTCDDPDRIRELIAWGVDGICTNVPDVALEVRRSMRRSG